MARYIDADAVHQFVNDKVAEGKGNWKNGVPYEWAFTLTVIDNQPTAEVEEVKHGEWIVDGDVTECSNCHKEYVTARGMLQLKEFDYCPHCGAKMDGGKEE